MAPRKPAPRKPAPSKLAAGTVLVQVVEPFQVRLDGVTYGPGETVAVAAEFADVWQINGWVTLA